MHLKQKLTQLFMWRGIYLFLFFCLNIILSRELEAAPFGDMSFHIGIFQIMTLLFTLNGETGIQYLALKDDTTLSQLVTGVLALTMFASVISYLVGVNTAPAISILHDHYGMYAAACVCGIFLTGCFTLLFYAKDDHHSPNVLLSIINIVLIVGICVMNDRALIIRVYLLSFLLQGICMGMYFCMKYQIIPSNRISVTALRSWWNYSSTCLLTNVIFWLVYRADLFFVEKYCSGQQLGNYIQAGKIGQMLLLLPKMIAPGIISFTMKADTAAQELSGISRAVSFFMIILFILLLITGGPVFVLMLGESFSTAVYYLLLLFPGIWALSIQSIISAYVAGRNKISINLYGSMLALMIILLGNIFFVPVYGVIAAAIISSVGYMVNMFFVLLSVQRVTAQNAFHFLFLKKQDLNWLRSHAKR